MVRNGLVALTALAAIGFVVVVTGNAENTSESAKANAFFEDSFNELLARSPMFETRLGIKRDYDKWDDLSDAHAQGDIDIVKRQLATLRSTIDFDALDEPTRVSYRLFVEQAERRIADFDYRWDNYPVNQMRGWQSRVPSFLINFHRVASVDDAEAYIARLRAVRPLFDQLIEGLRTRAGMGIIPPTFVFDYVLGDSRNVLVGRPFDDSDDDSTILADFRRKVGALGIDEDEKRDLVARAETALAESVRPAYRNLIAYLLELEKQSTPDAGVWKFPDGASFYAQRLATMTTTTLTAAEIHELGLAEVDRIHDEMRAIMKQVHFQGSLDEFFAFMRDDERFYYEDTEEGRQDYLDGATDIIDAMKTRLDMLFLTKPTADIIVKRVEPFREKSAGKAFYERPSPDGTRPGTYYANLYDMRDMPIYQMEALAYHEGIPGHHMQIAIAQETEGLPSFRRYARYTAYTEGWGLYAELIAKEIGFYRDPYSDFGRLAMELWRACRLVVDTGIHDKKWTREQAIEYLVKNTPNPENDAVKAIERYIVMPGQATAYKIGMLRILELREEARAALGERFDIRRFHDVILKNGPVPLNVLDELVDDWIAAELAGS